VRARAWRIAVEAEHSVGWRQETLDFGSTHGAAGSPRPDTGTHRCQIGP